MHVVDPLHRIHKLPDSLINRIAAGEVIERPASVVKELLENSLDAGADTVTVEIEAGGSRLIRVTDNGRGIHADDLALAVDRHTTSKLEDDADLTDIATLGFRGEALASIAAVSRFSLTSCEADAPHATTLELGSGKEPVLQPAAHPPGTTAEVHHLFYNMPARKKFLRSEKTEFLHILELVKRIALSRFDLSLRLLHNQRQVFQLVKHVHCPEQRVQQILGKSFYRQAVMVNQQAGNISLFGWMGLPAAARSQTDQQYIYLNGRIIRDRMVQHAIRAACQEYIYPGRYPAYVLYLQTGLSDVDINVHPTKYEVRFRDTRRVFDFMQAVIARALDTTHGHSGKDTATNADLPATVREITSSYYSGIGEQLAVAGQSLLIKGRYLLVEDDDGLNLVDIHTARKLILRYRLLDDYGNNRIKIRPVLVPLSVKVKPGEQQLLENHRELLESLGLQVDQDAPDSVMIRGLPSRLTDADAVSLFRDTMDLLRHHPQSSGLAEKLINAFSTHANDAASQKLSASESDQLINELNTIKSMVPTREFYRVFRHLTLTDLKALF